jgi:hypothetical protein
MARENEVSTFKRKYPRKSFRKAISFICGGKSYIVQGVEIGEGGLSFRSDLVFDTPKKIILNFFLSDQEFFSIRASLLNSINRNNGKVYGVSFEDVSIALKRQIRTYVARTGLN